MVENIVWYKQAGFKVSGSKVIYFDPWGVEDHQQADLILVTHTHFDHFSPSDIAHLRKEDTLVCVPIGADGVEGKVKIVKPGDSLDHMAIKIEVIHAYNTNKSFHAKGNLWVGYVVTMDGKRYYHAGDTDLIPEMNDLKDIDVAMVKGANYPVGPLAWADEIGPRTVRGMLKALNKRAKDRYPSIAEMRKALESFFARTYRKSTREVSAQGIRAYCKSLTQRAEYVRWADQSSVLEEGQDHFVQSESKILPLDASPYDDDGDQHPEAVVIQSIAPPFSRAAVDGASRVAPGLTNPGGAHGPLASVCSAYARMISLTSRWRTTSDSLR